MNELIQILSRLDLRPKAGADVRSGLRRFLAAVFRADLAYYGVVRAWQEAAPGSRPAQLRPHDGPAFLVDTGAGREPASPGMLTARSARPPT